MMYLIDCQHNRIEPVTKVSVVDNTLHVKTESQEETIVYDAHNKALDDFDKVTDTIVSNGTAAFIKDLGIINIRCTRGFRG